MQKATILNWIGKHINLGSTGGNYYYLFEFAPSDERDWRAAKQFLADRISMSYLRREALYESLRRFGCVTLLERIREKLPTSEQRQKSEFGEIVCQLVFESVYHLFAPVKHRYKDSPNVPVHGMDVVAFRFSSSSDVQDDTMYFAEVKTTSAKRNPPRVAYKIRDTFQEVSFSDITSELQYILTFLKTELVEWLYELGSYDFEELKRLAEQMGQSVVYSEPRELEELAKRLYERVEHFHDPYELHKRKVRLCPFLVRQKRFWKPVDIKCIVDQAYDYPISLTVVTFDNLSELALEIYRLARAEND